MNRDAKSTVCLRRRPLLRIAVICTLVIAPTVSPALFAEPSAETLVTQGNGKGAIACATCHGADGSGLAGANFVRLAGLDAAYLAKQLRDFAAGRREQSVMQPIAAALSPDEIEAVARYFATRPRPTPPAAPPTASVAAASDGLGERLARRGNWDKSLPACFQCHGPDGAGIPPHFPAIAGQPADYIQAQITAWRAGSRRNDPGGLMRAVADKLSTPEIEAVSVYLATLPPRGAKP